MLPRDLQLYIYKHAQQYAAAPRLAAVQVSKICIPHHMQQHSWICNSLHQ
jgi:hypothetical protein